VGQPAPEFSSFDLEGRPVKLSDFRGRVVLLNFWASWCAPCRQEFPRLAAVHGRGDVVVLGVLFDDTKAAARRFADEHGATWTTVVDPQRELSHAYRVGRGIPVTFLIDREGVVRVRHAGELRADDLARLEDIAAP
jgi:peroxiredoxin